MLNFVQSPINKMLKGQVKKSEINSDEIAVA